MHQGICLLAFGETGTQQLQAATARLAQACTALSAQAPPLPYTQKRPLLEGLSNAFSDAQTVLLLVQPDCYIEIKQLLFSALGFEAAEQESVLRRVGEQQAAHALFPANAELFLTENGLFSGFSAKEQRQQFFYLPADADYLGELLQNGLRQALAQLPPVHTEAPDETVETVEAAEAVQEESGIISLLFAAGLDVALAQIGSAQALLHSVEAVRGYEKVFIPAETPIEKGELSRKRHIALLAKTARQESGCTLGVALSGVFELPVPEAETSSHFVYIGIADERYVRVLKVNGIAGEDPALLRDEAIRQLFTLLEDYARAKCFSPPQKMEIVEEEEPRKRSWKLYLLLVAVTLLLCVAVAFAVKAYWPAGWLPAGNTAQQTSSPADSTYSGDYPSVQQTEGTVQSSQATQREHTQTALSAQEHTLSQQIEQQLREDALQKRESETSSTSAAATRTTTITAPPHTTGLSHNGSSSAPKSSAASTLTQGSSTTQLLSQGVFRFTAYGFGHGVGMSQTGATALAKQGKNYFEIAFYYFGLSPMQDTETPRQVSYNGTRYSLPLYLAKTVEAEIGGAQTAPEALKVQALVAYTYAKSFHFNGMDTSKHAFSSAVPSDITMQAVYAVLGMQKETDSPQGQYLAFQGKPALTPYFSSAGGKTANVRTVWGGSESDYPYLKGGVPAAEELSIRTQTLTVQQIRELVAQYNRSPSCIATITLQEDPSKWIQILKHDQSVNSKVGYIEQIRIGNVTMSGNHFRYYVLDMHLRSHCFTYNYSPNSEQQ